MPSSSSSSSQQISSQFKLFESNLQGINNTFTLLQSQSTQQWRNLFDSISNFKISIQNSLKELESKEIYLKDLEKRLNLREEHLYLRKKQPNCVKVSEIGNVVVKIEDSSDVIEIDDDYDENCEIDASIKLFITMDGKALQVFMNDKVDMHFHIGEEVRSAIKLSSDAAKLVLDAMVGFFPPRLRKGGGGGGVEYEGSVVRSSCVVLLEQLMELKVRVRKVVREEARVVAKMWWENVKKERGDCKVVLGFLLLVVVYDVWSDFDRNELMSVCEVVKKHRVFEELNSRIWFLRKCGVISTAPTFQKEEHYAYASPANSMASPVQKEGPYTQPVNFSGASPAQKEMPYTPPVDFSNTPPLQKERPYNPPVQREGPYTPPEKFSDAPPAQKDTPPVDFSNAPPVQNERPYNPPVQREGPCTSPVNFSIAPPSVQKEGPYPQKVKLNIKRPVQKKGPHPPPVNFSTAPLVPNEGHFAPPFRKEGPFTPPINRTMAPPLKKDRAYTLPVNFSMTQPVQKEVPYTPSVANTSVPSSTESTIDLDASGTGITAIGLKSYLIKNVKDLKLLDEKVLEYLLYASDSAKLVFDIVQDFYLELDGIQGDTNMSCCVFLLEQLILVSPHITTLLKEEIMNFAARWKARLAMKCTKPSLVFCFLKFLAAYKLSGSFEAYEILSLFTVLDESDDVYTSEQISKLCRALGLEEKIPELVQSLIKGNKHLEAVRYICAFQLADKFPPSPLLKEYLDYTKEAACETCKNSDNSIKAQNKSASRQIRALQNVLKCIFEFKLDFECSPIDLQQQIRQLEQEKKQRKSLKTKRNMTGKKRKSTPIEPGSLSDCQTPKEGAVFPTVTPSEPLEGHSLEECPHLDIALNSGTANIITPMDLSPSSSSSP